MTCSSPELSLSIEGDPLDQLSMSSRSLKLPRGPSNMALKDRSIAKEGGDVFDFAENSCDLFLDSRQ